MSRIKEAFTSRFTDGCIVEMDYSQLEVAGLAILSQDPVLLNDLAEGIDLHCMSASRLFGKGTYSHWVDCVNKNEAYYVKKRKLAKILSFQLQYGAGVNSMSESLGVEKNIAEKFITIYYDRYQRVKEWQDECKEAVEESALPSGRYTANGWPANEGKLVSPTGRIYKFTEYDSPQFMKDKGIHTSFSPTQIKNYPVQGFSTGDLVPLGLGLALEYILDNRLEDHILLINTIHDSILFDCVSTEVLESLTGIPLFEHLWNLRQLMMSIVHVAPRLWGDLEIPISIGMEIEVGPSWATTKPIQID